MIMKYCVYLTSYFGNQLPPFYLGSTSIEKIQNGYRGSVSSIEYRENWKNEDASLFKVKIISRHKTRREALEKEELLQRKVDAPHNPLYINKAFAVKDGCFGVSKKSHWKGLSGSSVPWFGKKISNTKNIAKAKVGKLNPSAGKYEVYDNEHILQFTCIGNLIDNCELNGVDRQTAYHLKKSIKCGPLSFQKTGTGPKPKFDSAYVGWYAIKIITKPHQKVLGNAQKNKRHIFNTITGERKMISNEETLPMNYSYGYPKKFT